MTRKRVLLILAAAAALFNTHLACAQDFFIHTVTKGQGIYSISRIYGIDEAEILKLNPISDKILHIGQELRIPQKKEHQGNTFHTVAKGETLYSLSKKYRVSIKEICNINPGLTSDNLKTGMVIGIPPVSDNDTISSTAATVSKEAMQNSEYKTRIEIGRRVTIYRICNDYNISEEDFLQANPQYRTSRLRHGDIVNIPYSLAEREAIGQTVIDSSETVGLDVPESSSQHAGTAAHKPNSVNAVLLLPLSLDDSLSSDRPKMIEFTRGVLMAVNKLKNEGISVNLKVIDAGTDVRSLERATANGKLDNTDVVFGPKYSSQIERMAKWSTENRVPLVLPFNADDKPVYNNPYVFQLNTPQSYFHQEIYDHFIQQFPDPNIIILDDGNMKRNEMLDGLKHTAAGHGFPVSTVPADTGAVTAIMARLDTLRQNVFIVNSPEEGPLLTMLPILQVVNRTKNENIRTCLFGYPEYQIYASKHLDEMSECDTWFYSWFFTNNTLKEATNFSLNFIKSFNRQMMVSYPSYAPYGYDAGYYFMKGIAAYGNDFEKHLDSIRTRSVQMEFKFQRISQWGGYINHKVFFVHFSPEYKVEKIDFDK